jgi:hypothetical protein
MIPLLPAAEVGQPPSWQRRAAVWSSAAVQWATARCVSHATRFLKSLRAGVVIARRPSTPGQTDERLAATPQYSPAMTSSSRVAALSSP